MRSKKIIVLTGSTGFVGSAIAAKVRCKELRLIGRCDPKIPNSIFCKATICKSFNYLPFLQNSNVVVHSAARVHVMKDLAKDPLAEFRAVNVEGTLNLAKQAAAAGVKRFIFLSSIKVNGERTEKSSIFRHNDIPKPEDSYGKSKWEAEKGLWEISKQTGLEVVIIRAPLVYGPGVKGNLERLIKIIKSRIPLPFSLIKNQRSLVGIDNLVDLIVHCIDDHKVSGNTFLVSDEEDISTPDLVRQIASSMGLSVRLFPIPLSLLKFFGFLLGKKTEIDRLVGSLRIDNSYTKEILNWTPPISVEEGIRRMIQGK